jgi:hypothetical protein
VTTPESTPAVIVEQGPQPNRLRDSASRTATPGLPLRTKSALDRQPGRLRLNLCDRGAEIQSVDSAGASARREHDRRRAARERAVRERHPRIGRLLLKLTVPPAHERAWERGADGEERAGARLEQRLNSSGVIVLHDRRLTGSRANIDHLAVGPGGVTVIDTKRLAGKVEVRGRGQRAQLRVGGRDRTKLLDGVQRQLAAVTAAVPGVDVRAALCFVDPDGLPWRGRLEPRGILIDGTRGIAKLAKRPGPLDLPAIDETAATLAARFPPAAS